MFLPTKAHEKEIIQNQHRIRLGNRVPEGAVNLAYSHLPAINSEENILVTDLSNTILENVQNTENFDILTYPNGALMLQTLDGVSDLPTEDVLITNAFDDGLPLYYSHRLALRHYDETGPDQYGIYRKEGIAVVDKSGNAVDRPYQIQMIADTDHYNLYHVIIYTSFKDAEGDSYQVVYNAVDVKEDGSTSRIIGYREPLNVVRAFTRIDTLQGLAEMVNSKQLFPFYYQAHGETPGYSKFYVPSRQMKDTRKTQKFRYQIGLEIETEAEKVVYTTPWYSNEVINPNVLTESEKAEYENGYKQLTKQNAADLIRTFMPDDVSFGERSTYHYFVDIDNPNVEDFMRSDGSSPVYATTSVYDEEDANIIPPNAELTKSPLTIDSSVSFRMRPFYTGSDEVGHVAYVIDNSDSMSQNDPNKVVRLQILESLIESMNDFYTENKSNLSVFNHKAFQLQKDFLTDNAALVDLYAKSPKDFDITNPVEGMTAGINALAALPPNSSYTKFGRDVPTFSEEVKFQFDVEMELTYPRGDIMVTSSPDYPGFRQSYNMTKSRPEVVQNPMIELNLDPMTMADKFSTALDAYCEEKMLDKTTITAIRYKIVDKGSDYEPYFKKKNEDIVTTIRVLELTPDSFAENPMGRTSIQEAVRAHGNFDPSKTILITQDVYSNWNKYTVDQFDVLTFTPGDCNGQFDLVSAEMEDFVRRFKAAPNRVVILTHDTGGLPRFKRLFNEFGFQSVSNPYKAGSKITLVDPDFVYPYALTGSIEVSTSHQNVVAGGVPMYTFDHAPTLSWLSRVDNVYFSESGHSLYSCGGAFMRQLHDNEMKIWINLICRIADWKEEEASQETQLGLSKLYATVDGQEYVDEGDTEMVINHTRVLVLVTDGQFTRMADLEEQILAAKAENIRVGIVCFNQFDEVQAIAKKHGAHVVSVLSRRLLSDLRYFFFNLSGYHDTVPLEKVIPFSISPLQNEFELLEIDARTFVMAPEVTASAGRFAVEAVLDDDPWIPDITMYFVESSTRRIIGSYTGSDIVSVRDFTQYSSYKLMLHSEAYESFYSPHYAIQYNDTRKIEVLPPREKRQDLSWYLQIKNGRFERQILDRYDQPTFFYSTPEYYRQTFLPETGFPYRQINREKPDVLNASQLRVRHTPLVVTFGEDGAENVTVTVNGKAIGVKTWDSTSGVFEINGAITENDDILIDYQYEESYYTYRGYYDEKEDCFWGLDLNPSRGHYITIRDNVDGEIKDVPTFRLLNKTIYLYLYPSATTKTGVAGEQQMSTAIRQNCLFHSFEKINDAEAVLLAEVRVRPNSNQTNVKLIDTRTRGGGLKPEISEAIMREFEEESSYYWDIGYYDGKPYSENGVIVVRLTRSVLKEYGGRFTRSEVEERLEKYLGYGVLPIIEFVDDPETLLQVPEDLVVEVIDIDENKLAVETPTFTVETEESP